MLKRTFLVLGAFLGVAAVLTINLPIPTHIIAEPISYPDVEENVNPQDDNVPSMFDLSIITSKFGNVYHKLTNYYNHRPLVGGTVTFTNNIIDIENNLIEVKGGVSPLWLLEERNENGLQNGNFTFTVDLSQLNGLNEVVFTSKDYVPGFGERGPFTFSQQFIVDNVLPSVNYSTFSSSIDSVVSGNIVIDGQFYDEYGLYKIGIGVDGNVLCTYEASDNIGSNSNPVNGEYICNINTTLLDNGTHTIYLYALDKAGNETILSSKEFETLNDGPLPDITAPEIEVISGLPEKGLIWEPINLIVNFKDEGGIKISGFSFADVTYPPFDPLFTFCTKTFLSYDYQATCQIAPFVFPITGVHTLRIYAEDLMGNRSYQDYEVNIVEMLNDKFSLVHPYFNSTFNTPIVLDGYIKNPNTNQLINLYYKEGENRILIHSLSGFDDIQWSYSWTPEQSGVYDIIAEFIDSDGHTVTDWVNNVNFVEQEDITAPIFITKDVTRDEGENMPSVIEFVASNPENLAVSCSLPQPSDLMVNQPDLNKIIPVTCFVTDDAGNTTTSTSNLIVNNVLPKMVFVADPAFTINEGNEARLSINILQGNALFTYNWNGSCVGSGTSYLGLTPWVSLPKTVGIYNCSIEVIDADGDKSNLSTIINIIPKEVIETTSNADIVLTSNEDNNNVVERYTVNLPESGEVQGIETETNPVSSPININTVNNNIEESDNTVSDFQTFPTVLVILVIVLGGIFVYLVLFRKNK